MVRPESKHLDPKNIAQIMKSINKYVISVGQSEHNMPKHLKMCSMLCYQWLFVIIL